MKGAGFGLVGDLIVGVIGSFIGVWVFGLLGIVTGGILGLLIASVVGALLLLYIVRARQKGVTSRPLRRTLRDATCDGIPQTAGGTSLSDTVQ